MVRLKALLWACFSFIQAYFNSTMVRLKVATVHTIATDAIFQFHNGSIKSSRILGMTVYKLDFNSTMVRLKVAMLLQMFLLPNFNSTMVRLKDFDLKYDLSGNLNFNSTMVRLKAVPAVDCLLYFGVISIPQWFD